MAVTVTYNAPLFEITGTGFYAELTDGTSGQIRRMGYISGQKVRTKFPVVADPGLDAGLGGTLPAFLLVMHQGGVQFSGAEMFDLDSIIQKNGLDFTVVNGAYVGGEYDKVEALDFCVLTGRKFYKKLTEHLRIPANFDGTDYNVTPRPTLDEVPNGENDLLPDIIKFLGLSGYLGRLLAAEAISWDEFIELATYFWKGNTERIAKEYTRLRLLRPLFFLQPLTELQRNQFLKIGDE